jgi:hypothetical protein
MGHSNWRNGPLLVVAPANILIFWVINQQVPIDEICSQNYGFTQPFYYSKGMSDFLTEDGHWQVEDSLDGELTSSGAETLIQVTTRLFFRTLLDRNFPKFHF